MLLISLYQTKCYLFDEPADLEIKRTFNDRFTRMLLNSSLKTSTICRLKGIKEYAYDKTKFNSMKTLISRPVVSFHTKRM